VLKRPGHHNTTDLVFLNDSLETFHATLVNGDVIIRKMKWLKFMTFHSKGWVRRNGNTYAIPVDIQAKQCRSRESFPVQGGRHLGWITELAHQSIEILMHAGRAFTGHKEVDTAQNIRIQGPNCISMSGNRSVAGLDRVANVGGRKCERVVIFPRVPT
jgi:hypothetical protein